MSKSKIPDDLFVIMKDGVPTSITELEIPFDKPMRDVGWTCELYIRGQRYYDLRAEVERLCTMLKEL